MEEVTAGATSHDHKQAVKDRLKAIRDLMRVSRYKPARSGDLNVPRQSGRPSRLEDNSWCCPVDRGAHLRYLVHGSAADE
jgi:hypothetical protein